MAQSRLIPSHLGLLCILLFLVSCGSMGGDADLTPLPSTSTPLPPPISTEFPTGIFYHKHPGELYCLLQFNKDGTMHYYWMAASLEVEKLTPSETGTYSVAGTRFTLTSSDMSECPIPVTYSWTFDSQDLTFQLVGSDCADRQATLENPLLFTFLR